MKSRTLWRAFCRATRPSGVPPAPNNWSKTIRGSRVIGSGSVGDAQLMVSVYTHAYP